MTYATRTAQQPRGLVGVIATTVVLLILQLYNLANINPASYTLPTLPTISHQTTVQPVEATTTPIQAPAVTTKRVHSAERPTKPYAYDINSESISPIAPIRGKPLTRGPPVAFVSAYGATINKLAQAHNLPPELIYAVIATESGFNPKARTSALGLMQIKHSTAKGVGFKGAADSLFDPTVNLQYGTAYLAKAYQKAGGDACRAVSLYNRGLAATRLSNTYCARVKDHIARYGRVTPKVATQDAKPSADVQTTTVVETTPNPIS